jgi:hypothetical protein
MVNMEARNSNGRFKEGHPGFKPKGSANEFQTATRDKLGEFLKSKLDELPTIYEKLGDRDKSKLLLSVAEFFLPKQKEIFTEDTTPKDGVDFSLWSDEDLELLISLQGKYINLHDKYGK